ncbi:cytosolic factor, phosphatidylinositol/phosphatidylcholine transfer protein [Coelomomyces lativittatus]|nr:cytosolic factor, phosphatidylinositol/phosphatidylcholine transfer protein [Coelomomyces lativittatus]
MNKNLLLPTNGRKGHLTQDQSAVLEAFQLKLLKENKIDVKRHDELLYLRFLRARKFDVELSKAMFLASEAWRLEFQVDQLVSDFQFPELQQIRSLYPQYYHKVDKLGRPIYIEHFQNLDLKKIQEITTMERMQQRHVVEYEKTLLARFPACSKKCGQDIEQSCTILDLQGVSLLSFSQVPF